MQAWEGWPARQPCLLFAGLAFNEPKFLELWKKLPPDPKDEEMRRNVAITQPVRDLWRQKDLGQLYNERARLGWRALSN